MPGRWLSAANGKRRSGTGLHRPGIKVEWFPVKGRTGRRTALYEAALWAMPAFAPATSGVLAAHVCESLMGTKVSGRWACKGVGSALNKVEGRKWERSARVSY